MRARTRDKKDSGRQASAMVTTATATAISNQQPATSAAVTTAATTPTAVRPVFSQQLLLVELQIEAEL